MLLEVHPTILREGFDADDEAMLSPFFEHGCTAEYAAGYADRNSPWTLNRPQSSEEPYMVCLSA